MQAPPEAAWDSFVGARETFSRMRSRSRAEFKFRWWVSLSDNQTAAGERKMLTTTLRLLLLVAASCCVVRASLRHVTWSPTGVSDEQYVFSRFSGGCAGVVAIVAAAFSWDVERCELCSANAGLLQEKLPVILFLLHSFSLSLFSLSPSLPPSLPPSLSPSLSPSLYLCVCVCCRYKVTVRAGDRLMFLCPNSSYSTIWFIVSHYIPSISPHSVCLCVLSWENKYVMYIHG